MQYKMALHPKPQRYPAMALKPTIYKVNLNLVDMNREVYASERLTLALHPSETETRMLVRLLAYALNYDPDLSFTRGLSIAEEPELWQVSPDGRIALWIEVGQVSAERLRKGVSRADKVLLYAYGSETDLWWQKQGAELADLPKTTVMRFISEQVSELAQLCERNMELTITISETQLYITSAQQQLQLDLIPLTAISGL